MIIIVVTTDGTRHSFTTEGFEPKIYDMVVNAVMNGKGFMLEDTEKKIAYAPAGVARVIFKEAA